MSNTGAPLFLEYVEANTLTPDVPLRAMMDAINANAILYAGTWSSLTSYYAGQLVIYNNALYRANASNTNKVPGVATEWDVWLVGATGPKGDTGDTGPTGPAGATGATGAAGDSFVIDAVDLIANRSTYDGEAAGFNFLANDESKLYVRVGTSGWSAGVPFGTAADGNGKVIVDVSGGVDVNLNQYQSMCGNIELTGTITADINVNVYDAARRSWRFFNNTSGAFGITVKTPSGSGAVVTQGTSSELECDGTNIAAIVVGGSTAYTASDSSWANGATLTVTHASDSVFKRTPQLLSNTLRNPAALLMHMNGTNGSTTFTDEVGNTVTPTGSVVISTAQSKFGGASASFPSTGSYLSMPSSSNYEFGSGDLTMEFWVKTASTSTFTTLLCKSNVDGFAANGEWTLVFSAAGKLGFYLQDNSPTTALLQGVAVINDNTWHHVAITRNGSAWKMFVDGAVDVSATYAGSIATLPVQVDIGIDRYGPFSGRDFVGYIDEMRFVKGTAKYTAAFTPPSAAFPNPYNANSPLPINTGSSIGVAYADVDGNNQSTKTTFTNNTGTTLNATAVIVL